MPLKNIKRRNFLKTCAVLTASFYTASSFTTKRYKPLLSFSTLGCPDWDFQKIVTFASTHNYDGIEVRGIQRELDLTKAIPFNSKQNIANSLKLMQDHNLKFVNLGSSAALHFTEGAERQKNIDAAKRFIDLAQ